ncbi:MAG: cytidylate kinase family protein [candidate division NC10 bacterium]|nr:cytidylate kinase family protein [candidate division NC10 bacterium]
MAIITISSLSGSGRTEIAKPLAEKLGYSYVDKEAIFAAAESYGWLKKSLAKMDERHVGFWERSEADRRNYLTLVEAIITDFARKNQVVIVGRGANLVLQAIRHALRVKLYAPFPSRVRRIAQREGIPEERAKDLVARSDRERSSYIRYVFDEDWMNPDRYDVMLDTEHLSPQEAIDLLVSLANSPSFQPRPASLEAMEDLALGSRVKAHLVMDGRVATSWLDVRVERGKVTLGGLVETEYERSLAEEIVRGMEGVREVENLIGFKLLGTGL